MNVSNGTGYSASFRKDLPFFLFPALKQLPFGYLLLCTCGFVHIAAKFGRLDQVVFYAGNVGVHSEALLYPHTVFPAP